MSKQLGGAPLPALVDAVRSIRRVRREVFEAEKEIDEDNDKAADTYNMRDDFSVEGIVGGRPAAGHLGGEDRQTAFQKQRQQQRTPWSYTTPLRTGAKEGDVPSSTDSTPQPVENGPHPTIERVRRWFRFGL